MRKTPKLYHAIEAHPIEGDSSPPIPHFTNSLKIRRRQRVTAVRKKSLTPRKASVLRFPGSEYTCESLVLCSWTMCLFTKEYTAATFAKRQHLLSAVIQGAPSGVPTRAATSRRNDKQSLKLRVVRVAQRLAFRTAGMQGLEDSCTTRHLTTLLGCPRRTLYSA